MKEPSIKQGVFLIFSIWILFLGTLLILQLLGYPFGFRIIERGESCNWYGFIRKAPNLIDIAHQFWQIDWRNPLSPWYWMLVSKFITTYNWALYSIRTLLDPILALTIYFLVLRLGKNKNFNYAIYLGLATLFWNFFVNYDQLIWVFYSALCFSLLSILFYCKYVDSGRQETFNFAISLICYFAAISTYTLQSGAIIAIGLIALFRQDGSSNKLIQRFLIAARDTVMYFIIFIVFYLIWDTSSLWVHYMVNPAGINFTWAQFFKSIGLLFFHIGYLDFLKKALIDWQFTLPALIISFLFFVFILSRSFIIKINDQHNLELPLNWILAVQLSLAFPIVVLESTNNVFIPGTRSPMISQVWQPLLYMSIIFMIYKFYNRKYGKNAIKLNYIVSILLAIIVTIALDFNHNLGHII